MASNPCAQIPLVSKMASLSKMIKLMSLTARREILENVRQRYSAATWQEKGKILNGFVAATDYERKYACRLLSSDKVNLPRKKHVSPQCSRGH